MYENKNIKNFKKDIDRIIFIVYNDYRKKEREVTTMYKATREIEVTFNNNKTRNITIIAFALADDDAKTKVTREVEHYANNPCTVEIKTAYENIEWF